MTHDRNRQKILFLTQFSVLLALEAIVCFTPLGSLPALGPIVATLGMVPVIITAIMLGTGAGAAMGFLTGLFSFLVWTFMPPPQSAAFAFVFTPFYSVGEMTGNFWSLVICFVPRTLVGVVTGLTHSLFRRLLYADPQHTFGTKGRDIVVYGVSGVLGSLTNTLLVTAGIYLFFGKEYAAAGNLPFAALLGVLGGTILFSGIPEAIIGGLAAYGICRPLKKMLSRHNGIG